MPTRWPLAPRKSVDRAVELLECHGGVALLGSDGVGKTTVAEQIADRLGEKNPVRVIATATQAAVPFGAFGPLVEVTEVGRPAALIHSALDSLLAQADSPLIVVDDAQLLDPLSATLVYQLARRASGRLIVTARAGGPLPSAVAALWEDGLVAALDVGPLDEAETQAVLAALEQSRDDAYRRTGGNPLELRMLMQTRSAATSLETLVDAHLAGLTASVRTVLAYLAVHEPLSRADLAALTSADAVEQAETAGATITFDSMVYAGHPLFIERVAREADPDENRRLRTEIVTQLATHSCRDLADRLGRAVLALDSDAPEPVDDVVAAAQQALRLGDLSLSERLAAAAVARSERFDARLALSYALAWQGRGREADAVLADMDAETLSEAEVMAWALPRAANQFWMLSEPERATAFLRNIRKRISTTADRLTLDALSATFAMNAGNLTRAVEIGAEVLAAPEAADMAVAWAASASALCSARMGRFDQVGPLVARALGAEHPGLLRFTVGLAETTTLLMTGQPEAARDTARQFTDFAELAQPGRSIGEVLLAQVLIARGDPGGAARLLGPAAATLERTGYSWGPLSLIYLATALAQQGEITDSAKALARAESRHGTKSALFAPELGVARAWRLATVGDTDAAIATAREAARGAERGGQLAVAVWAWNEAAGFGDTNAAGALAKLAETVDCAFARAALERARS
ncbi:AAA family ATPase [Mycobacterium sp. CVI_P3]|uniref:AAA family ATPase n=1 Tax=Mycobacterium pinniadriaticum TaxID=2994102 RepID=A0ABT3SCE0_9MYCO|nr:AAA family ATPase [Mycobacterium pinniadriaticum]MCX2930747.1 AAA family ATPase [Mycobacterium pinniadriaticum]MCX2937171.1 AAA family ATPase [Mycobacterium pinniadriaticum]